MLETLDVWKLWSGDTISSTIVLALFVSLSWINLVWKKCIIGCLTLFIDQIMLSLLLIGWSSLMPTSLLNIKLIELSSVTLIYTHTKNTPSKSCTCISTKDLINLLRLGCTFWSRYTLLQYYRFFFSCKILFNSSVSGSASFLKLFILLARTDWNCTSAQRNIVRYVCMISCLLHTYFLP